MIVLTYELGWHFGWREITVSSGGDEDVFLARKDQTSLE